MKILLFSLSFMLYSLGVIASDFVGTWAYTIKTPDGNIEDVMTLQYENSQNKGTITGYGKEYKMVEIEVIGIDMIFKTNAAGYSPNIKIPAMK